MTVDIEISHVMQNTKMGCVAACMAMITKRHQDTIRSEMGGTSLREEFDQWVRMGYMPELHPFENELSWERVFLATVPSLNVTGGNHRIVIDTRLYELTIYDPNFGRGDAKFYETEDDLVSWSEITTVRKV